MQCCRFLCVALYPPPRFLWATLCAPHDVHVRSEAAQRMWDWHGPLSPHNPNWSRQMRERVCGGEAVAAPCCIFSMPVPNAAGQRRRGLFAARQCSPNKWIRFKSLAQARFEQCEEVTVVRGLSGTIPGQGSLLEVAGTGIERLFVLRCRASPAKRQTHFI